jgi:hypothetical protein
MRFSTAAIKLLRFFSISRWILLAETYAISIPEKKAEKSRDTRMIKNDSSMDYFERFSIFFLNQRLNKYIPTATTEKMINM